MAPETVKCHSINHAHQLQVHSQSHNQWQIQDCPDGEMPTTEFGPETYYLARLTENCMKMKEIGPGGKSLVLPSIRQCHLQHIFLIPWFFKKNWQNTGVSPEDWM